MFEKYRNWKEILLLVLALLVSAVFYIPLAGSHFAIYVALGVFYTVVVFGWSLADPQSMLFSGQLDRSAWTVLAVHTGYIAVVVSLCGLAFYLGPHLPLWLAAKDSKGGSILVAILIVIGVGIGSVEENWLSAKGKGHNQRKKFK